MERRPGPVGAGDTVAHVSMPAPGLVTLAAIAGVQGVGLLAYAVFDVVEALRVGLTGPVAVSNPPALIVLVSITAVLGLGMLWLARGWWRAQRWARAPFIMAQLLVGLIGFELAQSEGVAERSVGLGMIAVASVGLVVAMLPAVGRALEPDA